MQPESSPLGGAYVWIEKDAQLVHGQAGAQRAKAKFFEGPIAEAAGGGAGVPQTPLAPHCTALRTPCAECVKTDVAPCTVMSPCQTHLQTPCVPCPTHQTPCHPCIQPTQLQTP